MEEREKDEREKDERRDSLMMPVPRRASSGHPLEKSAICRCPVKGVQKSASTSQLTLLIPNAGQSTYLYHCHVIVSVSPNLFLQIPYEQGSNNLKCSWI